MQEKRRRWWPVVKALLCLAILAAIAWRFAVDLSRPELYEQPLRPGWLVAAALLYLTGMSLSGLYWWRLLVHLGAPVGFLVALKAYWVSQLGKYLPGKAMAVILRVGLVNQSGTPAGLAALTTFYEVMTTMASGAILAAALFIALSDSWNLDGTRETLRAFASFRWPEESALDPLALGVVCLGLVAVTLGPILPAVFNRLVHRLSLPFRSASPPRLALECLAEGLLLTAPTWLFFGVALGCALQAIPGAGLPWGWASLARLTAVMAAAYVAGFVIFIAPGGLGVREFLITVALAPELTLQHDADPATTRGLVVLAVLLLRIVWTIAELLVAGTLYWTPGRSLS